MNNLQTWLQSSADPTQVSNTVRGFILAMSAIIMVGTTTFFHVTLTPDNIVELAGDLGGIAGSLWAIYGLILKFFVFIGSVKEQTL